MSNYLGQTNMQHVRLSYTHVLVQFTEASKKTIDQALILS